MDKKALRDYIRQKKRQMTAEQIERAGMRLAEKFIALPVYQQAQTIYGYMPYNQEVRTIPILEHALQNGKRVAVPKVYGDEMRFIYVTDLNAMKKSSCGIPEPVDDGPVADDPNAVVLMPGLAFDRQGHRIGYGGGFYDKFLAKETNHPKIALCYDFQMLPFIETDAFDIPVDQVIWTDIE